MSRSLRIQLAGACYYVFLQGNNRQDIFLEDADRKRFLDLLRLHKQRAGLSLFAYCLLPNEIHMVVQTNEPNLSAAMQGLNTAYTKYFNRRHDRAGHVFGGRYKAYLVDQEKCLMALTRYVHLLPASTKPWRYPWSSCSAYVERREESPLVDSEEVLKRLGRHRLKQSVRYLNYIKTLTPPLSLQGEGVPCLPTGREGRVRVEGRGEGERGGLRSVLAANLPVVAGRFIGDREFVSRVHSHMKLGSGAAAEGSSGETVGRILNEISKKFGVEESQILGRSRWRSVSSARKEAIHRAWKQGMGVTQIGRFFQRTPGAISQVIRHFEFKN